MDPAHRGSFAKSFDESMVPTLALTSAIAKKQIPVIASGGLMDGRDIAEALRAGAFAVQLGTAFLACDESGAAPVYKRAILDVKRDETTIIRAYSGRPARGLANAFANEVDAHDEWILPFPIQNTLTRAMRAEASKRGDRERLSLWAGRGVTRARAMPVAQLIETLVEELRANA